MITAQDIINFSKPHRNGMGGRQTVITNGKIDISIVGGAQGLYGDFYETFEIAFFDKETQEFVTKYVIAEANDDVIGYVPRNEIEEIVNRIFEDNFQVL